MGNRLETLADLLAERLAGPLVSVMEPELILVQSQGMEHWISLELARRHAICANVQFPFPNRFIEEIHARVTGASPSAPAFAPHRLRWHIFRELGRRMKDTPFEDVLAYLTQDSGGLRRFQLADRIADTFDQYLVFRPDMIFRWEAGDKGDWQAELWRALVHELPGEIHRAARVRELLKALESPATAQVLPSRVSVFGISALPRFHMDVLAAMARFVEVNLFLMNPCREYWGDIVSERDMARTSARKAPGSDGEDLHFEKGHPLLASTGMMGRDFFDMIHDFPVEEIERFEDPGQDSLLHALQSDILLLRERGRDEPRTNLSADDDSIRIHSCHSPLREVEVLHDRLLELFEQETDLEPDHILVTTPDIETYAPLVRAVFDTAGRDQDPIPYSIADRSIRREGAVIDAFMALLDLDRERFALSRVIALLESPSVLRRFHLTETEMQTVRRWMTETGIRWGLDGLYRGQKGLPPHEENTWTAGIQRLLLGYAMAGQDGPPFETILPYDPVEGGEVEILEKLLDLTSALFPLPPCLNRPKPPSEWGAVLLDILDRFFAPDEDTEREFILLRRSLNELSEAPDSQGPASDEPISLDVVRWFLGRRFDREGLGFGFMTGGVTFCAMLPMRSIPFRVICCLGLNSDAFPKSQRAPDFDLMARNPRPGDRSRRNDDRYLFLETILSARTHLHLSYVGRSQQDNGLLPPSVLVSELMDTVAQGFDTPEGDIQERLLVEHRLQPFSPAYFSGAGPLRSYSRDNLASAKALVGTPVEPSAFIPAPLDPPGAEWHQVALDDLVRFYRNPSAFLLRSRLGVAREERADPAEDREPFSIEALERYILGQEALERSLNGEDPRAGWERARASGVLPHGSLGRTLYDGLARTAALMAEGVAPHVQNDRLEPLPIHLEIGGFQVTGSLDGLVACGRIQYRFAPIRPKDRLSAWILHLALNAADPRPVESRRSVLMGLASGSSSSHWEEVFYDPVEKAEDLLLDLLKRYLRGLSLPLPFFPKTSWAYAHALRVGEHSEAKALEQARKTWEGNDFVPGECIDSHAGICFRYQDPLETRAFHEEATGIFGPLIDHEKRPAP